MEGYDGKGKSPTKNCNRHLLLHTSGLSYTKFGDLSLSLMERCLAPLSFEPGEGFIYGSTFSITPFTSTNT